jgi:hypothetical protein
MVVPGAAIVFRPEEIDASADVAQGMLVGPASSCGSEEEADRVLSAADTPAARVAALLNAGRRGLRQDPELQARVEAVISNEPMLLDIIARQAFGQPTTLLGPQHLPLLPASASDESEDDAAWSEEQQQQQAPPPPRGEHDKPQFDPLAELAHGLTRLGAWLRAKVVDPLLGLADDDETEKEEQEQQQEGDGTGTSAAAKQRPAVTAARPHEGVKDAADAWLGALTSVMIAIVMVAILRRPAVAREFVRAAMRGAAAASAARRGA